MKSPAARRGLLALLWLWGACSSGDALQRSIDALDQPSSRERAIGELLGAVRRAPVARRAEVQQRVLDALMDAYRSDDRRGQLVAALASLGDRGAEPVLRAAVEDADRAGEYLEAAMRAAGAIGRLGLHRSAPAIIETLTASKAKPRAERKVELERALIGALGRLHETRALALLVELLKTRAVQQSIAINRAAARALGRLRTPAAARPLIEALAGGVHGRLLYEDSRRALCELGAAAVPSLSAASRADGRGVRATAAVRLLADLGVRSRLPAAQAIAHAPVDFRLAVAEARLRRGPDADGERMLRSVADDRAQALPQRQRAAELLGWYGSAQATAPLAALVEGEGPAPLRWAAALAHARVAGAEGARWVAGALERAEDAATARAIESYRPRLELAAACAARPPCYLARLGQAQAGWRVVERAALELGRAALTDRSAREQTAVRLAQLFTGAHPQVREAVLVGLERLDLEGAMAGRVARILHKALESPERSGPSSDPIASRVWCLARRLERVAGGGLREE